MAKFKSDPKMIDLIKKSTNDILSKRTQNECLRKEGESFFGFVAEGAEKVNGSAEDFIEMKRSIQR